MESVKHNCIERVVKLYYLDIESGFMVIFFVVSCSDGDLKLVGGSVVSEGRLQICFNKRWSTINAHI